MAAVVFSREGSPLKPQHIPQDGNQVPLRPISEWDPDVLHPGMAEGSGEALGASLGLREPQPLWAAAKYQQSCLLPWSLLWPLLSLLQGQRLCRRGGSLRLADTSPVGKGSKSHVPGRMQAQRRWALRGKSVVPHQKCEWHRWDVITCSQRKVSF